jgi:hypothetical protein
VCDPDPVRSIWRAALNVARVCKQQAKPASLKIPFGTVVHRADNKFIAIYPTRVRKGYTHITLAHAGR